MVMFINIHTVRDGKRFNARKNCRAAIALFFGIIPVLLIAGQVHFYLTGLKLCFLQAENICIQFFKYFGKSLFHNGTQPVDVPRDKFHSRVLSFTERCDLI